MISISFTARAERQTAIDAEKEAFKILSDIYSNQAEPLLIEEVRLVRDLVTTRMVEDAIPEDYMEDFIPEWYLYEDWSVKMVPGLWLKPNNEIVEFFKLTRYSWPVYDENHIDLPQKNIFRLSKTKQNQICLILWIFV